MSKIEKIIQLSKDGISKAAIAKELGIRAGTVRKLLKAVEDGYDSYDAFLEKLAKDKGFSTRYDYRLMLYERKSENNLYARVFSSYLQTELDDERNQKWLANRARLSKVSISRYYRGQSVPSEKNARKIFSALESPYETLDDLIMDHALRMLRSSLDKKV